MFRFGALLGLLLAVLPTPPARAQVDSREAAASAFDSGADAYRAGEFSEAADWFETAHRYAPAAESLIAAARAHDKAGHALVAGNLALRLIKEFPDNDGAKSTAAELLDHNRSALVEITVRCQACVVTLDGQEQDSSHFFVEPDQDYLLEATQGTMSRRKRVHGSAGQQVSLRLADVKTLAEEYGVAEPAPVAVVEEDADSGGKPLPPLVTYIAAGLTGAGLVTSLALTIDAASGQAAFREATNASNNCTAPDDCRSLYQKAERLLDDGHKSERRANIAWVATGGLAVATLAIAIFLTDWEGEQATTVAVMPSTDLRGGRITVRGAF